VFIVIVHYPALKEGEEGNFREWFKWSSALLGKHKGFVSRRLLQPIEGGDFAAIIEYESREVFATVGKSPEHDEAASRMVSLFEGHPRIASYEVVAG
jgi:heme-degrading monooxygenase HmoA